jgi:hypothetical protein
MSALILKCANGRTFPVHGDATKLARLKQLLAGEIEPADPREAAFVMFLKAATK